MKVKEIMTTDVKSTTINTHVGKIAQTMCFHHISGLPVIDDEKNILGIVSERDVLHKMFPDIAELASRENFPHLEELERDYASTLKLKAKDIMTEQVITISPDSPVLRATSMMRMNKIRRIPVSQDGKLVGVISVGDVHRAIFLSTMGM